MIVGIRDSETGTYHRYYRKHQDQHNEFPAKGMFCRIFQRFFIPVLQFRHALLCILIVRGIFFRCHFPGNIMQSLLHIVFNFRFKIGNNMDILPTVLAVKRTFFHFRPAIRTLHIIILLLPARIPIPGSYSSA